MRKSQIFVLLVIVGMVVSSCAWPWPSGSPGQEGKGAQPAQPVISAEYTSFWNASQPAGSPFSTQTSWNGRGWLYVADEVSNGVSVIDLPTGKPIAFIPAGPTPHHAYLSKDERWVFVTQRYGNYVLAIDTKDNSPHPINLPFSSPAGPLHMAFSPDGKYAFASLNAAGAVAVIDARTAQLVTVIRNVGKRPRDIAVTPDSRKLYVSLQADKTVAEIDIPSWKVHPIQPTATDYGKGTGSGLGLRDDGNILAVSNTKDNQVVLIDTATDRVVAKINDIPHPVNVRFLGKTHIAATGNRADGSVSFIDTDAMKLIRTVKTGSGANLPYLGPDGNLWASANGANYVSVLDPKQFHVLYDITVVLNPHWIYFVPGGKTAFVTNWGADAVSVIDVATKKVVQTIKVGLNPNGMAVKTDVSDDVRNAWLAKSDAATRDLKAASNLLLPPARSPAEKVVFQTCTVCHDMGRIIRNNAKGDQWVAIVERMKGNGAKMTAEQEKQIIQYLQSDQQKGLKVQTEYQKEHPQAPGSGPAGSY